ncbi:Rv1733c family protein [Streptomyces sp. NPDC002004]
MRAIVGLWRWRRNPLRRTTDLVEAWMALGTVLLMAVVIPVVGIVVATLTDGSLQQEVRAEHHHRHLVAATVVRKIDQPPVDPDPETSSARDAHRRVLAAWVAPDGTRHRGTVVSDLGNPHPGDRFGIWTDPHGRTVARPLDSATATTHAVLAGLGTASTAAGLVECGRRLVVWRMVLRRYARWDQAWAKAGPDWGRTGTGS